MQDIAAVFTILARRFGSLLSLAVPFAGVLTLIVLWPSLDPSGFDAVTSFWGRLISSALVPGFAYYLTVLMPWWMALIACCCWFAVLWHRRLRDGDMPLPRPALVAAIVYSVVVTLTLTLALFALVVWTDAMGGIIQGGAPPIAVAALLGALAALILTAGRLLPLLPAMATGDRAVHLLTAWRMTRGETWRIGLGLLIVSIPAMALLIASGSIAALVGGIGTTVVRSFICLFGAACVATYATVLKARLSADK